MAFAIRVVILIVIVLVPVRAWASTEACVASYEEGQRARQKRDLVRAEKELSRCAQSDCPELIHNDCSEWLREVQRQIPTLIVSARWNDDTDVTDARVYIDGTKVRDRLDGVPVSVNPGEHKVRVETDGVSSETQILINQGEHDRPVRFVLVRPRSSPAPAPTPSGDQEPEPKSSAGPGALPWVLAGVSVVALTGFGYFALKGRSDLRELRDSCAPNCPESDLDAVKQKLLIADILLGVGVVAGGASAYLFVSGGPSRGEERSGATLWVRGHF